MLKLGLRSQGRVQLYIRPWASGQAWVCIWPPNGCMAGILSMVHARVELRLEMISTTRCYSGLVRVERDWQCLVLRLGAHLGSRMMLMVGPQAVRPAEFRPRLLMARSSRPITRPTLRVAVSLKEAASASGQGNEVGHFPSKHWKLLVSPLPLETTRWSEVACPPHNWATEA